MEEVLDIGNTEQFEKMAARYDSPERNRIATIISEAMRSKLRVDQRSKAMDFGCGTGLVGLNLYAEFDELVLVDSSAAMLKQVEDKLEQMTPPIKARTLKIDLEQGATGKERYSCILLSQVLLHIKDYQEVLLKLAGLLEEGGQLLIADFDENQLVQSELVHPGFNRQKLASELNAMGFEGVESEIIYEGDNLLMKQRASLFIMTANKRI